MNVLDVEGSRTRLRENSIASTLLFVYSLMLCTSRYHTYSYIFVVASLLYVVVATWFVVHMCVCAALDNHHVRCILSVSAYLCRVYCVGVAGSFCLSFLLLNDIRSFRLM